jgi:hypothetical protein
LSLGLQLVEIEALARIDRRRARQRAVLATGLLAVAVALAACRAVAATAPMAGGTGAPPALLAGVALIAAGGSVAAGALALRSWGSARRREADALTRQLRSGGEPGSAPKGVAV